MLVAIQREERVLPLEKIASLLGINKSSVLRKRGLQEYEAGFTAPSNFSGRPVKLYKAEVLELWGRMLEQPFDYAEKKRKERADKGKVRIGEDDIYKAYIERAKMYYISSAQANLREACIQAVFDMNKDGKGISIDQLYKRLTRKGRKSESYIRSEYYAEAWEELRKKNFRKKDVALQGATLRYDYFSMFENEGLAGAGYGVGRVIVIDDFKRDTWLLSSEDKLAMPWGLAFRDGLTGYPLVVLPVETITTNAIATGILMTAFNYGLYEDTVFVIENSRAMKNIAIDKLVEALYTDEQIEKFKAGEHKWIKELFYQNGPIVHNLPHLPRFPFKAALERNFKLWKDEFDATRFPLNYQGGTRQEAVQLNLASTPMVIGNSAIDVNNGEQVELQMGAYTVNLNEYWQQFYSWCYGDFINRPRREMLGKWAVAHNREMTIKDAYEYYNGQRQKPSVELDQLAYLLYWANTDRHKDLVTIRAKRGYSTKIKARALNLVSERIDAGMIGRKVATIPIPGQDDKFVVMIADDTTNPQFLCIAEDFTVTKMKQVPIMRAKMKDIRQKQEDYLEEQAKERTTFKNRTEPIYHEREQVWAEQVLDEDNRVNYLEESAETPDAVADATNDEAVYEPPVNETASAGSSEYIRKLREKYL